MQQIVDRACHEAECYSQAKCDGVMLENMHDVPWLRSTQLTPITTAALAVVAAAVRTQCPTLPLGVQVLSSGNNHALAIAKAAGLNFIRAEGWVFAHIGDEGYTQSCAADVTRYRRHLNADDILIFTDIKKKHSSHSLTSDVDIVDTARAAELFLSDGVIVTGPATGVAASVKDITNVQKAVSIPVLVGSGVTVDNVEQYLSANALIVGSHFKVDGQWYNDIDTDRLHRFMDRLTDLRETSGITTSTP